MRIRLMILILIKYWRSTRTSINYYIFNIVNFVLAMICGNFNRLIVWFEMILIDLWKVKLQRGWVYITIGKGMKRIVQKDWIKDSTIIKITKIEESSKYMFYFGKRDKMIELTFCLNYLVNNKYDLIFLNYLIVKLYLSLSQ